MRYIFRYLLTILIGLGLTGCAASVPPSNSIATPGTSVASSPLSLSTVPSPLASRTPAFPAPSVSIMPLPAGVYALPAEAEGSLCAGTGVIPSIIIHGPPTDP